MPHDNDQSRLVLPRGPQIDNPFEYMRDNPFNPFEEAAIEGWQENPQQGVDAPQPPADAPQPSTDAPQPSADAPGMGDDNRGEGSADAPQPRADAAQVADHDEVSIEVWKVLVKILDMFSDLDDLWRS